MSFMVLDAFTFGFSGESDNPVDADAQRRNPGARGMAAPTDNRINCSPTSADGVRD